MVHVQNPMQSIDLGESGDVHGEAAVWENDSEHCRFLSLSSMCEEGF